MKRSSIIASRFTARRLTWARDESSTGCASSVAHRVTRLVVRVPLACIQPYDLVMGALFIGGVLGVLRALAQESREDD